MYWPEISWSLRLGDRPGFNKTLECHGIRQYQVLLFRIWIWQPGLMEPGSMGTVWHPERSNSFSINQGTPRRGELALYQVLGVLDLYMQHFWLLVIDLVDPGRRVLRMDSFALSIDSSIKVTSQWMFVRINVPQLKLNLRLRRPMSQPIWLFWR